MIDTKKRIKSHEGFSPTVYEDTLGYKTVGYGHLVLEKDNFVVGEIYTPEELEGVFEEDYNIAFNNAHDPLEDKDIAVFDSSSSNMISIDPFLPLALTL